MQDLLRLRQTIPTKPRDYAEWHRGRKEYAAWTIGIESKPIRSRFDAARTHLSDFLLAPYQRQPHITLFVCGFLAEARRFPDDYAVQQIERHLYDLRQANLVPFKVKIGGIDSFATAPFLEVLDVERGIEQIRNVLSSTYSEIRNSAYVPHLTLGLYAGSFETKAVAQKIAAFPPSPPLAYQITELALTTYSASKIAGPLTAKYTATLMRA